MLFSIKIDNSGLLQIQKLLKIPQNYIFHVFFLVKYENRQSLVIGNANLAASESKKLLRMKFYVYKTK